MITWRVKKAEQPASPRLFIQTRSCWRLKFLAVTSCPKSEAQWGIVLGGLKHVWTVHPSRELRAPDGMEDIHQDGRRDIRKNGPRVQCTAIQVEIVLSFSWHMNNSELFYSGTKTLSTARLEQWSVWSWWLSRQGKFGLTKKQSGKVSETKNPTWLLLMQISCILDPNKKSVDIKL